MLRITLLASLCISALVAQPTAFDVKSMDRTADPCTDFYQYACGGWIKNNPVPPDQSRWGRFSELDERNKQALREILEEAAKGGPVRDSATQKIGDYYAACMDEKGIDAKGLAPLQGELDRIRNLTGKPQLAEAIVHLHRIGITSLFEFGSGQDYKDSTAVIAQLDQGGLGLPDRDYYLEGRREIRGAAPEVRGARAAHVRTGG